MEELADIIVRCLTQDKNYQRILYERYFSFAMKCAFRYHTDMDTAREIVLDSFIKVFQHLEHFCKDKNLQQSIEWKLMAWIKKIVINTSIDHLRRNKKVPQLTEITQDIWNDHAADVTADANILYKELLLELSSLSPVYRTVFNLHAVDGYTFKEIGEKLNITTGGAKAAYFKAKQILQRNLSDQLKVPVYGKS